MVSYGYTPIIQPYSRSQGAYGNRGPVSGDDPSSQGRQNPMGGDDNDLRNSSHGLQAVQYGVNQKIPLDAVIGDFKNTMSALGADEQTRSEVTAYLNVVRFQGSKDQPEVPYIKQTLRTAANSLDQFIGKALGQPSKVVKEWVDALLMQNIDYKADLAPESIAGENNPTANIANSSSDHTALSENTSPSVAISTKTQVKGFIEAAKTAQQNGDHALVDQHLQNALDKLQDANRPDWEGKVWRMRGRLYDQTGQWEDASQAYQQSADRFGSANLPQKQAQALQAQASILEDHGQLDQARTAYQQVVELDQQSGTPQDQIRSLNDLASVTLRQGDSAQAVQTLQQATSLMQTNPIPGQVSSDIYSNLGTAHQQAQNYPDAVQAFQQAMQSAKAVRDRGRYTSALQQLAATYVQSNQPDQAMAALRRLKNMEADKSA